MRLSVWAVMCLVALAACSIHPQNKNIVKDSKTVKLPEPRYDSGTSVEKALVQRKSYREFRSGNLSLKDISQLLWAAQGSTEKNLHRTAPSAGALYPLEIYLAAANVENLEPGIYKYSNTLHSLIQVSAGDKREALSSAALGQQSLRKAAAVILITGIYERTTRKYGTRGIRYVHMEAGHAAQNVYLQTAALNLGTVSMGAFNDEKVKLAAGLADDEQPLYLMPVGKIE